jgi:hypothetical protein
MMAKEVRYIDEVTNGSLPHYNKPKPIMLKAPNSKEALPDKVAQIEAIKLNEEEMALVIKGLGCASDIRFLGSVLSPFDAALLRLHLVLRRLPWATSATVSLPEDCTECYC